MSSYYFIGQSFAGPINGTTGTFSGVVSSGDGTAALPGQAFTSELSTGMWRPSAGIVAFSGTGVETARFSATLATFAGGTTATTGAFSGTVTLSNAAPTINSSAATTWLQTVQNAGATVAQMDKGGFLIPPTINQSTYYVVSDWDQLSASTSFAQNGNAIWAAVNSVSAPLMVASTMGVAYVNTSSATAGGYICYNSAFPLVASASIVYQWRILFYHPAASTGANRYTSIVGAFASTGTATFAGAALPFSGPYIKYSDNLNSGNWVLGSAVNNTQTTGNSAVAATAALNAWNKLTITLNNGTYTYVLNGVTLGTLADANITASAATGQAASLGGIQILPDGTNYTTNRVVMIDRSDFYVTGLSR